jgi:selenide,water dikinase
MPGVEVVLISRESVAPYSGLLPSRLAGWCSDDEMHFHLRDLCARAGAIFIEDEVCAVDERRSVFSLRRLPPVFFNMASINIGILPDLPAGASGHSHVLAVKPISRLLARWHPESAEVWTLIGGGAAGFELAMLLSLLKPSKTVRLLEATDDILPGHGRRVRSRARRLLADHGVEVRTNCSVERVEGRTLHLNGGRELAFDEAIFTTGARAPEWFASSGLPVNERGFLKVDSYLRVEGRANLFGAGDCIEFTPKPLAKAGVYAVREGPILDANLRAIVEGPGRSLRRFRPQRRTMALMTSGERRALLSYGCIALEGAWLWRLKNKIDRRFMRKFDI